MNDVGLNHHELNCPGLKDPQLRYRPTLLREIRVTLASKSDIKKFLAPKIS